MSTSVCWKDVISSGVVPDLQAIGLRDPDSFSVGGLHRNGWAWGDILKNHPLAEQVMGWIQNKVDILDFLRPFTGMYKKATYSSEFPPQKQFANHGSCQRFTEFISREILNRLLTGAFRIWGVVGVDDPPLPCATFNGVTDEAQVVSGRAVSKLVDEGHAFLIR